MAYAIRRARMGDEGIMAEMAGKLRLDPRNPRPEGFLTYPLDADGYHRRLIVSGNTYIAENHHGSPAGFLMCFNELGLEVLAAYGDMDHQDGEVEFVMKQDKPFIFADQIGVLEPRNGAGRALLGALFEDMEESHIPVMYASVLKEPVENKASFDFCREMGFEQMEAVRNPDGYLWVVHRKTV
jgi:hypothetical protein